VLALEIALEQGRFDGPIIRACAAAWARIGTRTVVRRLDLPAWTRVVAIGGATLGGSGKTPLAIACAAELAATGARVALVGHAHRARPRRARVVTPGDPLHEVGDEALVATRQLATAGVPVIVAPRRSAAIDFAARCADVLVLDGVAQTSPTRASLALLSVDAAEPWGRACVVPHGDLRAPKAVLLSACDEVVAIGDANNHVAIGDANNHVAIGDANNHVAIGDANPHESPRTWLCARTVSPGARVGDSLRTWDELSKVRVGLLCALARPDRVIRQLEGYGIALHVVVRARDHGPFDADVLEGAARVHAHAYEREGVDLWLATPKCALHLAHLPADVGLRLHAPVATIEYSLVLSSALRQRLRAVFAP
jgi:tetraacyldisaccharide 4'-kinase